MGGSQSVAVPGGGTEGYHVLRVRARSVSRYRQRAGRTEEALLAARERLQTNTSYVHPGAGVEGFLRTVNTTGVKNISVMCCLVGFIRLFVI